MNPTDEWEEEEDGKNMGVVSKENAKHHFSLPDFSAQFSLNEKIHATHCLFIKILVLLPRLLSNGFQLQPPSGCRQCKSINRDVTFLLRFSFIDKYVHTLIHRYYSPFSLTQTNCTIAPDVVSLEVKRLIVF